MAVGTGGGKILRIDPKTMSLLGKPIAAHKFGVTKLTYTADGRNLISGSNDYRIYIWNADTGEQIGTPVAIHGAPISGIALLDSGRQFVSSSISGDVFRSSFLDGWADDLCSKVSRNLTANEWSQLIPIDASYEMQCMGKEATARK